VKKILFYSVFGCATLSAKLAIREYNSVRSSVCHTRDPRVHTD